MTARAKPGTRKASPRSNARRAAARPAVPGRRKALVNLFADVRVLAERAAHTPIWEGGEGDPGGPSDPDQSALHAVYATLRQVAKALDVFDMGRVAGLDVKLVLLTDTAVEVQAVAAPETARKVIRLEDFRRATARR